MTIFYWIVWLINVLKAKFGSTHREKKKAERVSKSTALEGKNFLFWKGKDLSEKANQTLQKMETSLRNESWQQKKTVSQVAHLTHVVSLAGSQDWLPLNSMLWKSKNLWAHALHHLGLTQQRKEAEVSDLHFQPHSAPYDRGTGDSALEEAAKRAL